MGHQLDIAKRYLAAIEQGVDCKDLAQFFAPDVVQEEFPNRLTPNGARRDLAALLDACERGKHAVTAQRYEIQRAVESENVVVLEVRWVGTLGVALGALPVGGELRAHFAVVLEFRGDQISAQRNYDCFEPW